MDGFSVIQHKNKQIFLIDYSICGSDKSKFMQLFAHAMREYVKQPPNSMLVLVNVDKISYDKDHLKVLKDSRDLGSKYEKRIAVLGIHGVKKVAFNFVTGLKGGKNMKVFETAEEAKEWLVGEG